MYPPRALYGPAQSSLNHLEPLNSSINVTDLKSVSPQTARQAQYRSSICRNDTDRPFLYHRGEIAWPYRQFQSSVNFSPLIARLIARTDFLNIGGMRSRMNPRTILDTRSRTRCFCEM
jgi:hypothetical protein